MDINKELEAFNAIRDEFKAAARRGEVKTPQDTLKWLDGKVDPELLKPDTGFANKAEELRAANSAAFRSADDPEAQALLRALAKGSTPTPLSDEDKKTLLQTLSRVTRRNIE